MSDGNTARVLVLELTKVLHRGKHNFCIIKGIIRENEKPESIGKSLTCVGNLHETIIGAYYKLWGKAKFNERYNEYQLHIEKYEVNQTATVTGLQNYLAKECPFIGPGRADQIVKIYGEQAMEVLLTQPERLATDIVGVNSIIAQQISEWAKNEQKLSSVKRKLYEAGLTPALIKKLLDNHGENVTEVLRNQVFSLTEIKGIGFLTADRLAEKFGMPPHHPERVKEGILYTIKQVMDDKGHTCLPHHILINESCKLLSVDKRFVIAAMKTMLEQGELCTQRDDPKRFSNNPELFEEIES